MRKPSNPGRNQDWEKEETEKQFSAFRNPQSGREKQGASPATRKHGRGAQTGAGRKKGLARKNCIKKARKKKGLGTRKVGGEGRYGGGTWCDHESKRGTGKEARKKK